ncbi:hypothetical protein IVB18_37260 [Bradyrhizobium sp. 186]|uniref:hypothetical protein n=1 Tax=Bradyrhizobium sp. 186 TaxID=2782654 RepID=UPI0020006524|nr:hypothetical protein [Bradyrhizobium sp. 186]UPK40733.1 hypothetical protein IVB18_37260 [Bradyrhizobium sp. 186]
MKLKAHQNKAVMAGLSRPKDGVASLAYVPAIHALPRGTKNVDARDKPGHDDAERASI